MRHQYQGKINWARLHVIETVYVINKGAGVMLLYLYFQLSIRHLSELPIALLSWGRASQQ